MKHRSFKYFFVGFTRYIPLCVLVMSSLGLTWAPQTARTVNYSVVVEHDLENGKAVSQEQYQLSLQFLGDGRMTIQENGVDVGTFKITSEGDLVISEKSPLPAYSTLLLFNLLSENPPQTSVGASWETLCPAQALSANKISMQDKLQVEVSGIDNDQVELSIGGDVRLINNKAVSGLAADSASFIHQYLEWQPFLTGTAAYSQKNEAIESADLYYVLLPDADMSSDEIEQHASRQHTTITLVP